MNDVGNVINAGSNIIFAPIMLILYKLLVVWPNQIIYWFLDLIQKITGFSDNGLNGALMGNASDFTKIFWIFIGFGISVGIISFIAGWIKIMVGNTNDRKTMMYHLFKRSAFAIAVSIALPTLFYVVTLLLNTLFSSIFMRLTNSVLKPAPLLNSNETTSQYGVIISSLKEGSENNPYVLMNKLFVFNTWTVGYSGNFVNGKELDPNLKTVVDQINSFSNIKESDNGFNAGLLGASDVSKWNVLLSGIASIVFLFGIITFVVSVIAKLLWLYILMLISPLVLGGGVVMEKNTSKFVVDFVQKMIMIQVSIIGYFLFSMIYIIIVTTVNSNHIRFTQNSGTIGSRIFQFAILFAGITLINQIPVAMMKYFNSNEQVVSNELQEARSQINRVTQPLQTAMTTVIGGSVANARNIGRNTSNSLGEMKLQTPQTLR